MSKRTVIGLMSGTSHDGIDAVLVDIARVRGRFRIQQRAFRSFPYSRPVRARLLRVSQGARIDAGEVSQVNVLLGELFARAVRKLCERAAVSWEQVDAIGSHGHTVYHNPHERPGPGSTLQIGEPAVIAQRTGITTIADFRPADVALGGEGAPLVPYVHAFLFQQPSRAVAVHNIGGIANLTYLPPRSAKQDLLAFDTGPGNMLIDSCCPHCYSGQAVVRPERPDGQSRERARTSPGRTAPASVLRPASAQVDRQGRIRRTVCRAVSQTRGATQAGPQRPGGDGKRCYRHEHGSRVSRLYPAVRPAR